MYFKGKLIVIFVTTPLTQKGAEAQKVTLDFQKMHEMDAYVALAVGEAVAKENKTNMTVNKNNNQTVSTLQYK